MGLFDLIGKVGKAVSQVICIGSSPYMAALPSAVTCWKPVLSRL